MTLGWFLPKSPELWKLVVSRSNLQNYDLQSSRDLGTTSQGHFDGFATLNWRVEAKKSEDLRVHRAILIYSISIRKVH